MSGASDKERVGLWRAIKKGLNIVDFFLEGCWKKTLKGFRWVRGIIRFVPYFLDHKMHLGFRGGK